MLPDAASSRCSRGTNELADPVAEAGKADRLDDGWVSFGTMNIWANLFRHHRWSNLVVIDYLSSLTDEQLDLTVPGVFGSSMETVRHLISSDADYVRIIPDTPDVPQVDDAGPFGGWVELRGVADAADTALISYVDGLTEDMFFIDVDDGTAFDLTKSFLLGQIIHHATEHRSHIRTTLSAHGITPPEISLWAWRKTNEGRKLLRSLKTDDDPGPLDHAM